MSSASNQISNELVLWLKMLSLPLWARLILAMATMLIIFVTSGLVVLGLIYRDKDMVSSGVAGLVIAMPVSLIIVALVFGADGSKKLNALTKQLLNDQIPLAITINFASDDGPIEQDLIEIQKKFRGCLSDYTLIVRKSGAKKYELNFRVELNVYKANVLVWLPKLPKDAKLASDAVLQPYLSSFSGARKEGYVVNDHLIKQSLQDHVSLGVVMIKSMPEDFLLRPNLRLYFAQDLALFIRSIVDTDIAHG